MRIAAEIRRALLSDAADAEEISHLILRALHVTNRRGYPAHVITTVGEFFARKGRGKVGGPESLRSDCDGAIVGTASLDGHVIRSVYVDPTYQGKGIGARLMDVLESLAREQAVSTLSVPSSITAEGFYRKLGFFFVRDEFHGDERMIIMNKDLGHALCHG